MLQSTHLSMELFSRRRWATGSAQQSNSYGIMPCMCCITQQLFAWADPAFISCSMCTILTFRNLTIFLEYPMRISLSVTWKSIRHSFLESTTLSPLNGFGMRKNGWRSWKEKCSWLTARDCKSIQQFYFCVKQLILLGKSALDLHPFSHRSHWLNTKLGMVLCREHPPLKEASLYDRSPVCLVWIQELQNMQITSYFRSNWTPAKDGDTFLYWCKKMFLSQINIF